MMRRGRGCAVAKIGSHKRIGRRAWLRYVELLLVRTYGDVFACM
jgi:hypothetical protein